MSNLVPVGPDRIAHVRVSSSRSLKLISRKIIFEVGSHFLSVPRHNLSFASRAFHISAPKIWDSLPSHILQSQTLSLLHVIKLKTHYFQSTYHVYYFPSLMRPDFLLRLTLLFINISLRACVRVQEHCVIVFRGVHVHACHRGCMLPRKCYVARHQKMSHDR